MKVRQEYNIGQEKFLEWSKFNLPETISITHINISEGRTSPKATFTYVKPRKMSAVTSLECETFLDKAMLSYATKHDKRDIS